MALTQHHLIPKTRHRNKRVKRETDKDARLARIPVCRPCHDHIHAVLSEKELEREFHSVEKLKSHPDIARFAAWVRKRSFGAERRPA